MNACENIYESYYRLFITEDSLSFLASASLAGVDIVWVTSITAEPMDINLWTTIEARMFYKKRLS
jgi:hypothetical protein